MNVGSLFSGIGGIELGFEREGFHTKWFVENNPFCQEVLRLHFRGVPIYGDIRQLDLSTLPKVEILAGGFPCQPHSTAGKRKGSKDERNLWPDFYKAIRSLYPAWVVAENVPGLLSSDDSRFFKGILGDLAQAGYDAEWFTLSASQFGAPHRRERLFIVAYSRSQRAHSERKSAKHSQNKKRELEAFEQTEQAKQPWTSKKFGTFPQRLSAHNVSGRAYEKTDRQPDKNTIEDADVIGGEDDGRDSQAFFVTDDWGERIQRFRDETLQRKQGFSRFKDVGSVEELFHRPDIPQPLIRRGGHGFSRRLDTYLQKERTQAIGNAVVPACAQFIAKRIRDISFEHMRG